MTGPKPLFEIHKDHYCHTQNQVKQNVTDNLAPFFRSVCNALSDGVLGFAHFVAP